MCVISIQVDNEILNVNKILRKYGATLETVKERALTQLQLS